MTTTKSRTDPGRARKLAEQCFNLARSTTFPQERIAAISRGTAIAERAGLSLDSFDIPGRTKPEPAKPSEPDSEGDTSRRRSRPSPDDVEEMLRRAQKARASWETDDWYRNVRRGAREQAFDGLAAAMREARRQANAGPDETAYDARRRNFDEATQTPFSELYRRDDLRSRWPSIDAVVNALRARRVVVHAAQNRVSTFSTSPVELWIVTEPACYVLDQWSLRELADMVCG